MSLQAIEQVTQAEEENKVRRSDAETEAKKVVADAQKAGESLLQEMRSRAAEERKTLLAAAEASAGARAAEIRKSAEQEGDDLKKSAQSRMEEAADWIVGKVVEG